MKRTIATMLIGDDLRYLTYIKILLHSLIDTKSLQHGIDFCIITKTTLPVAELLHPYLGLMPAWSRLRIIPSVLDDFPPQYSMPESPVTLQKLNMFSFVDYHRVLFIDPDCFAEKNLDRLWFLPTPCFTLMPQFPFATSMMLIQPDMRDFRLFVDSGMGAFNPQTGWDNAPPPDWPLWHKRLFGEYAPYGGKPPTDEPWRFCYSATEDGIMLRHLYMAGRPQYSDGFDGIFHLSAHGNKNGDKRESMLLDGLSDYFLEAADRAGLKEELLEHCRERVIRGNVQEPNKY